MLKVISILLLVLVIVMCMSCTSPTKVQHRPIEKKSTICTCDCHRPGKTFDHSPCCRLMNKKYISNGKIDNKKLMRLIVKHRIY